MPRRGVGTSWGLPPVDRNASDYDEARLRWLLVRIARMHSLTRARRLPVCDLRVPTAMSIVQQLLFWNALNTCSGACRGCNILCSCKSVLRFRSTSLSVVRALVDVIMMIFPLKLHRRVSSTMAGALTPVRHVTPSSGCQFCSSIWIFMYEYCIFI